MNRATLNTVLVVLWVILALVWLVGGIGGLTVGFEHLIIFALLVMLVR